MKGLDKYLSELSLKKFNAEKSLSKAVDTDKLEKLDKKMKGLLPEDFKELYKKFNGENEGVGFMAGFELLSIESVIAECEFFKKDTYEYEPVGTEAISEKPMSKNKWVPFAFDGSDCFLAVDLSPSKKGKCGQVIGIDMEQNLSYLFEESMSGLFEKMAEWVVKENLTVESQGDLYVVNEKSGHLFNNVLDYAVMNDAGPRVMVPVKDEYWMYQYEKYLKKDDNGESVISSTVLAREGAEFRIMDNPVNISCEPFQYMNNVKQLVIHNSELRDFECLCKMQNLTTLFLVNCKLIDSDVSKLATLPKLKKLSLVGTGDTADIEKLAGIKSLKELYINKLPDFDSTVLSKFTGLTSLTIETTSESDMSFLSKLTKLKVLNLGCCELDNLDFLLSLVKLEEFELHKLAKDETALNELKTLTKLKKFIYPVRDLMIYKDHPSIETPGFARDNNKQYQVFTGTKACSFKMIGKYDDSFQEEIDIAAKEMGKYVGINSYGSIGI